jgi:hypothetical protein
MSIAHLFTYAVIVLVPIAVIVVMVRALHRNPRL